MQHRSLVAAALVALAACTALDMPMPGSPLQTADALVHEALDTARSPPAQQKASLQRAEQAFGRDASAPNRLRLALLLSTLAPPLRDDARAAELLEPIANPGAPGIGRVAALLAGQVGERTRMARERERAERERDKREDALRQQLEALRAIERGIQEREEKLRRPEK